MQLPVSLLRLVKYQSEEEKYIFIFICSFWFMAQPHKHDTAMVQQQQCAELVIPYTIKERHLLTQSWRAGFHVLHSPVSMRMHRKVQISHLLLFSDKSNIACPLPHWHSSHPNHLPIPSCTCVSLEPISITSFQISIEDFKTCQIC